MMKVLLLGSNGLLGQNIVRFSPPGTKIELASLESESFIEAKEGYSQIDFFNKRDLVSLVKGSGANVIINTAAMTNVDLCETEKEKCGIINRDAVGWVAECGIPMAHYSTDYVFDGANGPYDENSPTAPLGYYGKTKLESEHKVFSHNQKSLVLRTMLLWGEGHQLRPSFTEFVKSSLEQKKPINIVTDQIGNPTLASDLARATWALLEKGCRGLYHCSGSELLSRFEWAERVADFFSLSKKWINPVTSLELNQKAPRPLKSGFILEKLKKDAGFTAKTLKRQLEEVYG